jgi:16S rRNA (guanine527-N7)-methyltransferase
LDKLDRFIGLLLQRQERMNLIGASTIPEIWTRHVADSLQLLTLAPQARRWLDLGTGAGFPGIAIACALLRVPGAQVELVEKSPKKAEFLRKAVQALDIPAILHNMRIEDFTAQAAHWPQVVTARALAPLPRLLGMVAPFVQKGAKALLMKGQDVEAELTLAAKSWKIEYTVLPSKTKLGSHILEVSDLRQIT